MRVPPAPFRLTGFALACGLVLGCQTQTITEPAPAPAPSDLGRIATRLDRATLSALGVQADSLRFEAHRAGESVRWASVALGEAVTIENLSPGTWTVRVALYDLERRVRWIGDASVVVEAGRIASVRPSLRRGDGSLLPPVGNDPFGPLPEIALPQVAAADPMGTGLAYLPILGVERSERGITVRSRYACPAYATMRPVEPEFRRDEHGTAEVVVFGQDPDSWLMVKCASVEVEEKIVFLAFPPDVDVFLRDVGSAEYLLPRLCGGDGQVACQQGGQ